MPMIPCPSCGRQISDQSKRCFYCGNLLSDPAPAEASAAEREAKQARLHAMYSAGLGLPGAAGEGWLDRVRSGGMPMKLLAAAVLIPVMTIAPMQAFKQLRDIFRP